MEGGGTSVKATFRVGLLSGAVAGTVVDLTLFPLDTIKTRLQAGHLGTLKGTSLFQGVYRGIWPALVASAPAAATFFGTYDIVKEIGKDLSFLPETGTHLVAAAAGDVTSSAVRVPFEITKQRIQASARIGTVAVVKEIFAREGVRGFFKGYTTLVLRELPFDLIQFPLYEYLKRKWAARRGRVLETYENALCGSAAGSVAAGITTPVDVVKTRVMLQGEKVQYNGLLHALKKVSAEEGILALFSGILPRIAWISTGGFIFFGGYEFTKAYLLRSEKERR